MSWVLLTLLLLAAGLFLCYVFRQRRQMREILENLKSVRQEPGKKLFARGNGLPAQISRETNALAAGYEEQLVEQKRLEQANKELLSSLSHDLRTPLTSLLGYLDALEEGVPKAEEKDRYLATARKKAYDLKELVDALFDWFKIDAGEMLLSPSPQDICECSREILIDFLPVFARRGIEPSAEIPDEAYIVPLDPTAFRRILSNLLANALEHSGCGRVTLRLTSDGRSAALAVEDDGQGVEPGKLPHIFDRLYKADPSRNRRGSGLGLSIAKELTERQGGRIEAESRPGRTVFTVTFPLTGEKTM